MAKKGSKKVKDYQDLEIERYGEFMTENLFQMQIEFGRHYINSSANYVITLHKVNTIETEVDDLYRETKPSEKRFFKPIKLKGFVNISNQKQELMGGSGPIRDDSGDLEFKVYLKELEEKNIDIVVGDILAYNQSGEKERYYEVSNANYIVDDTAHTIAGMKPFWRLIVATPVKGDVVPFV